jgi:hypothetical protein
VITTGTQISKPVTKYFFKNRMLGSIGLRYYRKNCWTTRPKS